MADLKKLSNLLLFPTDSAPLLYSFVLEGIQEGWSWNASFSSLSPFPRCGRLLCTCFSIDEDTFSKAAEASLFQGSKEGIIWIFAIGYMTTLMSYHQWIAELMCFICFRGYSKTNVLLRLKNVHDLNTNRKYSMILLFCCWEMQGFLAYPGFSCPSLASLLSIFFFLFTVFCTLWHYNFNPLILWDHQILRSHLYSSPPVWMAIRDPSCQALQYSAQLRIVVGINADFI